MTKIRVDVRFVLSINISRHDFKILKTVPYREEGTTFVIDSLEILVFRS